VEILAQPIHPTAQITEFDEIEEFSCGNADWQRDDSHRRQRRCFAFRTIAIRGLSLVATASRKKERTET
jgi:hypothetical protein